MTGQSLSYQTLLMFKRLEKDWRRSQFTSLHIAWLHCVPGLEMNVLIVLQAWVGSKLGFVHVELRAGFGTRGLGIDGNVVIMSTNTSTVLYS